MKIFDVYFPQNNMTVILEEYKKYQKVKNRKSGKRGRQIAILLLKENVDTYQKFAYLQKYLRNYRG